MLNCVNKAPIVWIGGQETMKEALTLVLGIVKSATQHFERASDVERVEVVVQSKEDTDNLNGAVSVSDCTHLDRFGWIWS